MSCCTAFVQNFQNHVLMRNIIIQMMNGVRIVPVDTEIRSCRGQRCKAAHRLIRIAVALRIGILRNTPDTLYGRIVVDILLHKIHVRSVRCHRNVDHLRTEEFGNPEMTIISGNRAQEFPVVQLAPRSISAYTVRVGTRHGIKHDIQRRVAEDDHVIRIHLGHCSHQALRLRDSFSDSVVSAVRAGLIIEIAVGIEHIHQSVGQIQLCLRRLSSRHIKVQSLGLHLFELLFQRLLFLQKLFLRHLRVCFHRFPAFPHCIAADTRENHFRISRAGILNYCIQSPFLIFTTETLVLQGKRRILSGGNPVFQHIHHCGGFSPKKLQQLPGVHGIPHRRQIDAAIVCSGMQPAVEAVGREIMHHIKIILLVQTILIPAQTSCRFHDTLPHIEFSLFFVQNATSLRLRLVIIQHLGLLQGPKKSQTFCFQFVNFFY